MSVDTVNYISLGVSMGMLFGVAIGKGFSNLVLGMSIGLMCGAVYGLYMKKKRGNQEK